MSSDNEYMKHYMRERWQKRRIKAIEKLGGKCVECHQDDFALLQIDHIDPSTKADSVAKMSSMSEDKFWAEVAKCQLLCVECHRRKTLKDLNQVNAKETHGTLSSYKYCKCDLCKKAKADYMKAYHADKKRQDNVLVAQG